MDAEKQVVFWRDRALLGKQFHTGMSRGRLLRVSAGKSCKRQANKNLAQSSQHNFSIFAGIESRIKQCRKMRVKLVTKQRYVQFLCQLMDVRPELIGQIAGGKSAHTKRTAAQRVRGVCIRVG